MKKILLIGVTAIGVILSVILVHNYISAQGVEIRNARVQIRGGSPTFNQYNGSATVGATDYAFYTQALGGVDDYNDNQSAMPTSSYEGSWTDCTSGADGWCGTGETDIADAKDNQTGLIWSVKISGTDDTMSWFWANNCLNPGEAGSNGATCASDGDNGCSCVKRTVSKTGCEALGDGGWRLPYQKELMQAYINGSSKEAVSYLSSTGYGFWSSTTKSDNTRNAWYVYLYDGYTSTNRKTSVTSCRSRCVR